MRVRPLLRVVVWLVFLSGAAGAAELDQVTFKDGSVVYGTITNMSDGSLTMQTQLGGEVKAKWAEVASIRTAKPLHLVLSDGTELKGIAAAGEAGSVQVTSPLLDQATVVKLDTVTDINPDTRPVKYTGSVSAGASASDGNTRDRSVSLVGEFVARSKRQRFTLGASYNYAENKDGLTQRNAKGRLKYDFFLTDRLYLYANALLEGDTFQDLNLRATVGAGPGYQFIDEGDFEDPYFSGLQFYAEGGVSYVSEDYKSVPDTNYVSARWSAKLDWPLAETGVSLFHYHEGYPSLERSEDIYVTTEQGVRLAVWKNFTAAAQVNWRWDNTPSPGFKRSDTLYLLTLGYNFDL